MPCPQFVVDRPAVVGIDEAQVHQFVALVQVGHAGRAVLHERHRQAVERTEPGEHAGLGLQVGQERVRLHARQQGTDEARERGFVVGVRRDPTRVGLGLARRFQHVGLDALAVGAERGIGQAFGGQGAEQRLVEQVLAGGRRRCAGFGCDPAAFDARRVQAAVQALPAARREPPRGGHFGEHVDAVAHVFGALVVVGRRGQHRVRPACRARCAGAVKSAQRHAEVSRVAAHFVERCEPRVEVERRVFDALGRHRCAELLKAHGKAQRGLGHARRRIQRRFAEQAAAHEVEYRRIGAGAPLARVRHGPVDVAPVLHRGLLDQVGAVDRQACRDLGHGAAQRVVGVVTRAPVRARDAQQLGREHGQLRGQRVAHHGALALIRKHLEIGVFVGEAVPDAIEFRAGSCVDQHAVHFGREAVAGRAVHRPILGQRLVRRGDLLGHHVERARRAAVVGRCRQRDAGARGEAVLQALEILGRVVQAVGVVDAQAVDHATCGQVERHALCGLEYRRVFNAHCRELVDVEEAPVVDLVGGDAPESEAIRLRVKQLVQCIARAVGVEGVQGRLDRLHRGGIGSGQFGESHAVRGLVVLTPGDRFGLGRAACRQQREFARQPHQRVACPRIAAGRGGRLEHRGEAARVDRKMVFVIAQHEGAGRGLEADLQVARSEHVAVVVTEHRQQHLALQRLVERIPVDVEVERVGRGRAVLQHVAPPRVVATEHAHVVGHHVEDLAHAVRLQSCAETCVARWPAELGVDLVVRDNVVAVCAAGPRAADR